MTIESENPVPEAPVPPAPESMPKKNNTAWIIIAVVAVVLLCCCCLVLILGGAFFNQIVDFFNWARLNPAGFYPVIF